MSDSQEDGLAWDCKISEFKEGDLVELKSGSRVMTVNEVDNDSKRVEVVFWTEEQLDFRQAVISQHALNKISK